MLDLTPPTIEFRVARGATWKFILDIKQLATQTLLNLTGKKIVAQITQNGVVLDTLTVGKGITLASSNTAMVIQKDWTNISINNNIAVFDTVLENIPVGQMYMQVIVSDSQGVDLYVITYSIEVTDVQTKTNSTLDYLVSRVEINTNGFGVTTNVVSVVDLLNYLESNYNNLVIEVEGIASQEVQNKSKIEENTEYRDLVYETISLEPYIAGYQNTKNGSIGQTSTSNVYSYCDFIPVIPGQKIYFSGACVGSHVSVNSPSGLAGFSQSKTFVSSQDATGLPIGALWDNHRYALSINQNPANFAGVRLYNKIEIVVPDGIFWVRGSGAVLYDSQSYAPIKIEQKVLTPVLDTVKGKISAIQTLINTLKSTSNLNIKDLEERTEYPVLSYINYTGLLSSENRYVSQRNGISNITTSSNQYRHTDFIPVTPGEKIYYSGSIQGTSEGTTTNSGVAGYSGTTEGSFLSALDSVGLPKGNLFDNTRYALAQNLPAQQYQGAILITHTRVEITIPEGVNFIRCSGAILYNNIEKAAPKIERNEKTGFLLAKSKIDSLETAINQIKGGSQLTINQINGLIDTLKNGSTLTIKDLKERTEYPILSFNDYTGALTTDNRYVSQRNGVSNTASTNQYRHTDFIPVTPGEKIYYSGSIQGTSQGTTTNSGVAGYSGTTEGSFLSTLDSVGLPKGNLFDNTRYALAQNLPAQQYQGAILITHTRVEITIPEGVNYIRCSGAILYNNVEKAAPKIERNEIVNSVNIKTRVNEIDERTAFLPSRIQIAETKLLKAMPVSAKIEAVRVGTEPSNKGFSVESNKILRKLRSFTIEAFMAGSFDISKADFSSSGSFYFNKNAFAFTGVGTLNRVYSDTIFRLIHLVCRKGTLEIWENRKCVQTLNRTDALDLLLNQAESTNANTFRAFLYHSGLNYAEYSNMRVYNYDLSETEIIEAYNNAKPLDYSTPYNKRVAQFGQNGLLFDNLSSDIDTIIVSSSLEKITSGTSITINNIPNSDSIASVTIPHSALSRKSYTRLYIEYTVNSGSCVLKDVVADVQNKNLDKTLVGSGSISIDFANLYADKVIFNFVATSSFSIVITKMYVQQCIVQAEWLGKNIDIANLVWKDSSENGINLIATTKVTESYIKRDLVSDIGASKRANNLRTRAEIIAHRGLVLNNIAPENSIDSFILAARAGFKFVETDVTDCLENDKFVIMHDLTINRTCKNAADYSAIANPINVKDYSRDVLRANYVLAADEPRMRRPIPTLEEFLNTCKYYNLFPFIEIKLSTTFSNTKIQNMWSICRDILGDGNFAIGCFDYAKLQFVRTLSSKTHLMWFTSDANLANTNSDIAAISTLGQPAYASRAYIYTTETQAKLAKQAGQETACWTVGTAQFDAMMKIGVEKIITDWIAPNLDKQTVLFSDYSDGTYSSWKNEGIIQDGIVTLQAGQKLSFNRNDLQYQYLGAIYANFEIQGSCTISANNTTLPVTNSSGVFDTYFIQSLFAKATPTITITANSITKIKDIRVTIADF